MLAFSRVPPSSALAPAGSARPLGKVNANARWLVHMPPSISVPLSLSLCLHAKFLAAHFHSDFLLLLTCSGVRVRNVFPY